MTILIQIIPATMGMAVTISTLFVWMENVLVQRITITSHALEDVEVQVRFIQILCIREEYSTIVLRLLNAS